MTPFKTTWKYSIHVIVVFTIIIYIPEKEICALFPLDLFSYPGNFFAFCLSTYAVKTNIYFAIKLDVREISFIMYMHVLICTQMMRKSCALGMHNVTLRNHLKG